MSVLTMDPMEQRILLNNERNHLIQGPGITTLGGCEPRPHSQQEDESIFLTPKSSPAYSSDGSSYPGDMGYFPVPHTPPSMAQHQIQSFSPPPTSSAVTYIAPGSPCDDFCTSSPYSPPYDNSSPHSITCSTPPHHGSPSIPCTDTNHFTPFMAPSNPTIHDIPTSTLPLTSATSLPYDINGGHVTYSNVPITSSGYYPGAMPSHWESGSSLPSFDSFGYSEPSQIPQNNPRHIEGEVFINIIDRNGVPVDPDNTLIPQLRYYPDHSPVPSPNEQHSMFRHDMAGMPLPPELANGPCPPYSPHKPTKTIRKPKKPKPAIQVNDEHIKDIPTSAQLWEFTLRVLKKPAYHYMVHWENRKEGLFRFHDAPAFAALWGKHRNRPSMTYDKVARALRYYYKRDILNQVGGRLTYRFSKRLSKLYATDD